MVSRLAILLEAAALLAEPEVVARVMPQLASIAHLAGTGAKSDLCNLPLGTALSS